MKKKYDSPEFDLQRILFEQIMEQDIRHSVSEDKVVDGDDDLLG